ncbi:hypothetical protein [Streptomyces sp. NPDC059788]|uniref:hypothetical protein n=1 Tax=Streptomyces sp. NPDC059788 TaxID=3346948 RepID=UPI0036583EFE
MTHDRETTPRPGPHKVALSLIQTAALDYAADHFPANGPQEPNWEMHRALTATLDSWQANGTLREDSLLLTEQLAVDLVAYLFQQLGDRARMELWLRDFGDQVCQAQQHSHPAGPTAIEILSVVAEDLAVRPPEPAGAERLARIGVPYLLYLRDGHEVEDAREMALTFALWAGAQLAALMHHDAERITAYLHARENAHTEE